ncbi:hypothetical protein PF003_g37542 [Phytophthora fragariae]|nr:hypothetical protein PF003_g37542 [Phytophthora fragariae]
MDALLDAVRQLLTWDNVGTRRLEHQATQLCGSPLPFRPAAAL